MNTYIEGTYAKVEDALRAVDTLIMRGHDTDSITLISNQTHQEEQLKAVAITVKQLSDLTSQEKQSLGKHVEDVNEGRFVLQVTEKKSEPKKKSPDIGPLSADSPDPYDDSPLASDDESVTEDTELLEDLRSSKADPSNDRSNTKTGYSDDLKTPDETPLDNGPNRSL